MNFQKYHGTGNDFIMIDFIPKKPSELAIKMCNRHFGIGADGLIFFESSTVSDIKFNYFNSDGSIAPMCGNGMRCFVKYLIDNQVISKSEFDVETLAGIIHVQYDLKTGHVKVDLGTPQLDIFLPDVSEPIYQLEEQALLLEEGMVYFYTINLGTLHTIVYTNDDMNISTIGPSLSNHPFFPIKSNVNFVKILNDSTIEVTTYERGAGWTLSCGTGVSASAFVTKHLNSTKSSLHIHTVGGNLVVHLNNHVILEGPAVKVFSGVYEELI